MKFSHLWQLLNRNVLLCLKKVFWASLVSQAVSIHCFVAGIKRSHYSPQKYHLPYLIFWVAIYSNCLLWSFIEQIKMLACTHLFWQIHAIHTLLKFMLWKDHKNIVSKNIITEHMIKSNIQLFTNTFVAYLPNVWRLCKLGLGHRGNNSQSFLFAVFIWISTFAFFLLRLARSVIWNWEFHLEIVLL